MASNAWERAQEAIAHASQRATERDEEVITPDTAVSPFDASATTVLPHGLPARAGGDPDRTQRIPQTHGPHANGRPHPDVAPGPDVPGPDDDAHTVRFRARTGGTNPGTSPFPAIPFPAPGDAGHPAEHAGPEETPRAKPRRSWWRRLFG